MIAHRAAFAAWLVLSPLAGLAQAPGPAASPAIRPFPPVIDPARELKGAALVAALRNGGYVLYLRHAETGVMTEACDRSNLSTLGEAQAKAIGEGLRSVGVPLGEIYVSPACRAQDTARLLDAGKAIVTPDLAQVGAPGFDVHIARMARLATPPAAGRNTLLVSHMHGSNVWEQQLMIEMAEVAVYRPLGEGKSEPVARIPLGAWAELARTAGS